MSVLRKVLLGATLLTLIAAALAIALLWQADRWLDEPLGDGGEIVVEPGATLAGVSRELAARGQLDWPEIWLAYGRFTGDAGRIKAGEYRIDAVESPRSLLAKLVAGDVIRYSVTLIEGWNLRQVLAALHGAPKLAQSIASVGQISQTLNLSEAHAEGLFYPDTYSYQLGDSDADVLRLAHAALQRHLDEAWRMRSPDLPLSDPYELLTLASIVEKESSAAADRPLIAGVFANRLRRDMRLQTDPTVIYGLGAEFDGNLTRRHLRTPSPYNTYLNKGLPPTPIAASSKAALLASARPEPSDYLYFVARGDGTSQFSSTLAEHNAAVRRFQLGQGAGS